MAKEESVSENSVKMLAREATILSAAPESEDNFNYKQISRSFADLAGEAPLDNLSAFQDCIFSGATPPPKVLIFIAERIQKYLLADGNISLDRAFNLGKKPKVGHPLEWANAKKERGRIHWMIYRKCRDEDISIQKSAKAVHAALEIKGIAPESLAKEYSDQKMHKIFSDYEAVLEQLK
jgi:hypothetical protein